MNIKDYESEPKQKNRYSKILKILLGVFGALVISAGVFVYILFNMATDDDSSSLFVDHRDVAAMANNDDQNMIDPVDKNQKALSNTIEYNGKKYEKNENIVNLLFLGIDTNPERRKNMEGYRSDMVMVCAIDVEAKTATLISIPRDTYTTVYRIDENTGKVSETLQQKINAAYSYGGGATNYSFSNAYTCVEMFLERRCQLEDELDFELDIPVYLFASINMDGITHVASAVGGVEVTLDESLPGVGKKGATVLLKYSNAEEYIRNRHDSGEGDLSRASRQRTFMLSLAKTIKQEMKDNTINVILSLADDLERYVTTNLEGPQMLDFANILLDVNIDDIKSYTIPGEGRKPGSTYFFYHDEQATLELLLDVYYNEVS